MEFKKPIVETESEEPEIQKDEVAEKNTSLSGCYEKIITERLTFIEKSLEVIKDAFFAMLSSKNEEHD